MDSTRLVAGKGKVCDGSKNSQCGCMGTVHSLAASCFHCGWVVCEIDESSTSCPACSTALTSPMSLAKVSESCNNMETLSAYEQKDKLLVFDKENAKRTQVRDSQADYYSSHMWLSEEEKKTMMEKEKKRKEMKSRIHEKKLHISFDIAGRRVIEYSNAIASEEEEQQEEGDDDDKDDCNRSNKGIISDTADSASAANLVDITAASFSTFQNIDLEFNPTKAGEVYRSMKKL